MRAPTPDTSIPHPDTASRGGHLTEAKKWLMRGVLAGVLGTAALSGAGCSSETVEPHPSATPEAAVTYAAPEGADKLPLVSREAVRKNEGLVSTSSITYYADKEDFDWHLSFDDYDLSDYRGNDHLDPTPESLDWLPSGTSAPVLDLMIGTDGELRYKTHGDRGYNTNEEEKILGAVAEASPLLEAAMQAGVVSQAHIRVFEPNQQPENPEWEPQEEGLFVAHDHSNDAEPAIYYYLPANKYVDVEAIATVMSHEAAHGLMGHGELTTPSAEQAAVFTKACNTLRKSALTDIDQDLYHITSTLDYLRATSPEEYAPAFQAVIDALRQGTYSDLEPVETNWGWISKARSCFVQNPWIAFKNQVAAQNINGGRLSKGMIDARSELEINEMVEDWHDLLKSKTVYSILDESGYLGPDERNKKYGHTSEGMAEMGASLTNLSLTQPEDFGGRVAELPADQKAAVVSIVQSNFAYMVDRYGTNKKFMDYLQKQYAQFAESAKIAR